RMVCRNFILPEFCKPCLFLSSFIFAQLILPYPPRSGGTPKEKQPPGGRPQNRCPTKWVRFGSEEQQNGRTTSGMSGDIELFENPSNIKDLWASEQKIILYIPLF
ncbi:MAG: hypothetical protein E7E26_13375, partial [Clostridiales bacterium]|nr:hypothetical protein [Clostridiales bacterium]